MPPDFDRTESFEDPPHPSDTATGPATEGGWSSEPSPSEPGAPRPPEVSRQEYPFGGRVGRFRLLELLGEGGMGAVWLAEQSAPVTRRVALKLMRSALVSASARARFEGERQALARLAHPAIAQMYEAGTVDGVPWFAMELVGGEPLTAYCDKRALSLRERIELFVAVCRGIQFAHQKGILHRDLKPSNLLVSEIDGRPLPKIIDFGIAKMIDEPLSEATMLGAGRLLGTPGYISPESWNAAGAPDLDTRSDVYSLGVVFYELIAGLPPFDLAALGLATAVQRVATTDPPSPTRRLREAGEEARRRVAARRGLDPAGHLRALAGDLDAIVGRAIARDRERRYESASMFAADLERHLEHQPIAARPPSVTYRTRKFVRRHRAAVTVAVLAGVALVAALAGALVESARARKSEARAAAVASFLTETLGAADPWSASSAELTVREMLDLAVPRLDLELADNPDVRAELLETISSTYYHLGEFERAEALGRQGLELRRRLYGEDSAQVAAAMNDLAVTLPAAKRAEAEGLLRRCIEIRRKLRGDEHPSVARAYLDLSGVVVDPAERESLLRRSLELRERQDDGALAFSQRGLAAYLIWSGEVTEAERLLESSFTLARTSELSEERVRYYLGELRMRQGRFAEAQGEFLRSLEVAERLRAPRSLKLGEIHLGLARSLRDQGRNEEAAARFDQALAIFRDPRSRSTEHEALLLTELAKLDRNRGEDASAEAHLRAARVLWSGMPPEAVGRALADWALGTFLHARGDAAAAESHLCGELEHWRRLYPPRQPELVAAERDCRALRES